MLAVGSYQYIASLNDAGGVPAVAYSDSNGTVTFKGTLSSYLLLITQIDFIIILLYHIITEYYHFNYFNCRTVLFSWTLRHIRVVSLFGSFCSLFLFYIF